MKPQPQKFLFDKSDYERPTQNWVCGWTAEGQACRMGPDSRGRCRANYECVPVRKGDRWYCTRPASSGGKCDEDPFPDGTCCKPIPKCQPVRSLRAKRGMVTFSVFAFTFGVMLLLLGGPKLKDLRNAFVSPGDLSAQHSTVGDCVVCHTVAREQRSPISWLRAAFTRDTNLEESKRCLSCHDASGDHELKAHGLSPQELAQATERAKQVQSPRDGPLLWSLVASGPRLSQNESSEWACVICHQEHRGTGFNLTQMDNPHCQTCHTNGFFSFVKGHPEFSDYPYQPVGPGLARPLRWKFDHHSHGTDYYPYDKVAFTCNSCHKPDSIGQHMLTGDFERMCTSCHQHTQHIQGKDIVIFNLPKLDFETLRAHNLQIGEWPKGAVTPSEEGLTPFMKLLLSVDPDMADALEKLAYVRLDNLSDTEDQQIERVGRVVWAVKSLFFDLIKQGREELISRLETVIGPHLSHRDLAALIDQVPVDTIRPVQPEWLSELKAAQQRWLPDLMEEIPRYRAGETAELIERVLEYKTQEGSPQRNWYLEESDFSIRYRLTGHTDHFLRTWLDVTGRSYNTSHAAKTVFGALSYATAPGRCVKCHSFQVQSDQSRRFDWPEIHPASTAPKFTNFAHAPHLTKDCQTCHTLQPKGSFAPMTKDTCAECHTQKKAGDRCLMCHNYHVEKFALKGIPGY